MVIPHAVLCFSCCRLSITFFNLNLVHKWLNLAELLSVVLAIHVDATGATEPKSFTVVGATFIEWIVSGAGAVVFAAQLLISCHSIACQVAMVAHEATYAASHHTCVDDEGYGDQMLSVPLVIVFRTV